MLIDCHPTATTTLERRLLPAPPASRPAIHPRAMLNASPERALYRLSAGTPPSMGSLILNTPSPAAASSGEPSAADQTSPPVQFCHICSDRATGNHYGAISCDGCKGFFRRSVRKEHDYKCRFQENCNVDKTHRNACRACRLRRCILAGMRASAIQNERDIIGKRRRTDNGEGASFQPPQQTLDPLDMSLDFLHSLVISEKMCLQLRESVIKRTEQVVYDKGKIKYEEGECATLNDVGSSIHQQLCILVEWAKSLTCFQELDLNDQASLLKANAAPLIVFGVAYRSIKTDKGVYLANEKFLPLEQAPLIGDITQVVSRIVQELVLPMKELRVDTNEYVVLKAAIFFNPYTINASDPSTTTVLKRVRLLTLKALRRSDDPEDCRFGQLLLLLPAVHSIAQQLIEDVQLCHLFQLTNVDELMQELILHEGKGQKESTEAILEKLKSPV